MADLRLALANDALSLRDFAVEIRDAVLALADDAGQPPDLLRAAGHGGFSRSRGRQSRRGRLALARGDLFEPLAQDVVPGRPGVLPGDRAAAVRSPPRRDAFPHALLESRDEFRRRLVEADDLAERLELRKPARDDGLSGGEVFEDLDRVRGLRQRRAPERDRADVERG